MDESSGQFIGPALAKKGYAVAAIDACFNGERVGKGPAGALDNAAGQEASLFKLYLWQGRTLWGMMLREEQCLIDYLETRPEIDKDRIAATGMSMGCTRSWWLAAGIRMRGWTRTAPGWRVWPPRRPSWRAASA